MGSGYGRALKRKLRDHGCTFVRHGKGDHEIWYSPITDRHVTVDAGTRNFYTVKSILKQAGIDGSL